MKISNSANCLDIFHISWRNYQIIKKKALEEEFSPSGLLVSVSIAFFIVIFSSYTLSSVYYHLLFR